MLGGANVTQRQIENWAHQGAVRTSSATYHMISNVLKDPSASFADREFDVYLQGSYGNDTNIWKDSDVDIVVELTQTFTSNKKLLPSVQYELHEMDYKRAEYSQAEFRKEVYALLVDKFGAESVTNGRRSIKIKGLGLRRDADVVVCNSYRLYSYYFSKSNHLYAKGMEINNMGESVVNYPKLHSAALTEKHKTTQERFKPVVRILKNIKNRMIEEGRLDEKDVCSYLLECWLYNAPDACFVANIKDRVENACNWLLRSDNKEMLMPHGIFKLIGDADGQWSAARYQKFCSSLVEFYNYEG